MRKDYPRQLGEWLKHQKKMPRDRNLVAVIAVIDDVRAALDAGFSTKAIWANMRAEGRIGLGYETFQRHVRRILDADAQPVNDKAESSADGPGKHVVNRAKPGRKPPSERRPLPPPPLASFVFNATPKKEDLL